MAVAVVFIMGTITVHAQDSSHSLAEVGESGVSAQTGTKLIILLSGWVLLGGLKQGL